MNPVNEQIIQQIPKLRRYARGLTGHKDQADDLVQDCLARALAKISLWQQGSNLQGWLFTIMHNIFINDRQKQANNIHSIPFDEQVNLVAFGAEPEQAMHTDDMLKLLMKLTPAHREVLLLVSIEGQAYEEVASILNIPLGTVMSRLHRAREAMRKYMNDMGDIRDKKMISMRRIK